MTPFESAVRSSLEGSHGDRVPVRDDHRATALHHYAGLNYTVPLPEVAESDRTAIAAAGQAILEARALHPERSLAQHYSPLAMDPSLVAAHDKLDRLVDRAFGAKKKVTANEERARILFERYADMTTK